jgi:hypothetical protein
MATAAPQPKARHRFVPRFSLAAALLAMTLCAIGLWYWYRVPFEVEHKISKNDKELESVRRTWGGTVRHGPRKIVRQGKVSFVEHYRDGVLHGTREWFDEQGHAYISAEFRSGRLVDFRASSEYDQRLARHLAEGTLDNPRIVSAIFDNTMLHFVETPLKDAILILSDMHGIPITCQGLRKTVTIPPPPEPVRPASEAIRLNDQMQLLVPLDPDEPDTSIELQLLPVVEVPAVKPKLIRQTDLPVTDKIEHQDDVPLIVALGRILQPLDLVCDYRYGMLWIADREEAEHWTDPTGVSKLVPPPGSKLAAEWEKRTVHEFIQTPLSDVCDIIADSNGVRFDLSRLPGPPPDRPLGHMPVTSNVSGLPFRHSLGALLEFVGCQARLDGETIVVELQPDHPLAKSRP